MLQSSESIDISAKMLYIIAKYSKNCLDDNRFSKPLYTLLCGRPTHVFFTFWKVAE